MQSCDNALSGVCGQHQCLLWKIDTGQPGGVAYRTLNHEPEISVLGDGFSSSESRQFIS